MFKHLEPFRFSTSIQLRWKDIDQFGHVNNAIYPTYFEVARYYYCKEVNNWDWDDNQFIIASIHVDYLRPLFYPGDIRVYLRITEVGKKSFKFYYAITFEKNGIEKLSATGYSTQVMYDLKSKKTIEVPDRLIQEWKQYEKPDFFTLKEK